MEEHRVEGTQRFDDPAIGDGGSVSDTVGERRGRIPGRANYVPVSRMTLKDWGGVPMVISEKY